MTAIPPEKKQHNLVVFAAIVAVFALVFAFIGSRPVSADSFEADAITATLIEWSEQTDRADDPAFHLEYAGKFQEIWKNIPPDTACEQYVDFAFSTMLLFAFSAEYDTTLGLHSASWLLDSVEELELACRDNVSASI